MKPVAFTFTAAYPVAAAAPPRERLALRHGPGGKSRVVGVCQGRERTLAGPMPIGEAPREYARLRRLTVV